MHVYHLIALLLQQDPRALVNIVEHDGNHIGLASVEKLTEPNVPGLRVVLIRAM